jgi:hypothetical protein
MTPGSRSAQCLGDPTQLVYHDVVYLTCPIRTWSGRQMIFLWGSHPYGKRRSNQ